MTPQDDARDNAFDTALRARFTAHDPAPPTPAFRDALRLHLEQTARATTTTCPTPGLTAARTSRRSRWSHRRALTLGTVLAAAMAGGGVAVAAGVLPMPGADRVVLRTPASTVVHTGTATVDLGARPAGVTSVELTLTCLSAGTVAFADGASLMCPPDDVAPADAASADAAPEAATSPTPGQPAHHGGSVGYTLPLEDGQTRTTITATAGTRWSLTTAYSTRTPTDWATNANGQTYGVVKDGGGQPVGTAGVEPDLIAVAAVTSTGEQGYVRDSDLNNQPQFTSPADALAWQNTHSRQRTIPVYASDGTTVIGEFPIG